MERNVAFPRDIFRRFFLAGRPERGGAMGKKHRYKVSGTVNFFVDDILSKRPDRAIKEVLGNINDDVSYAGEIGNIELIGELKAEDLGLCNERKYQKTKEC